MTNFEYKPRPEWRWKHGYRSAVKAKPRKPANPLDKCQIPTCKHTREQHRWDTDAPTPNCGVDGCKCLFFHGPFSCNVRTHPFVLCPQYHQTQPEPATPKVDDWTLCARPGCGMPRLYHCTKGRDGIMVGNVPYRCVHYPADNPVHFKCTSNACAAIDETTGNFIDCPRFINPLLKKKPPKPQKPAKPRKKKSAAEPVAASLQVAATDSVSETAPAVKVRKPRKKKTAAEPGALFPPPPPPPENVLELLPRPTENE